MSIAHATHIDQASAAPALFPPEFVRRRRLVERLRRGREGMLAVLVAPPGYGKSSLIAEWAEAEDRRVICTRADRADEVLAALDSECDPCVVALDDAHTLPQDALRAALTSIRDRLPAHSTIAIATRSEPRLPLGRLRAHRTLIELRTPDLAMTPAEAGALLRRAGLELDFETIQTLVRRTEGWPAALYLAALSLTEQHDTPDGIAGFRGDNHLLAEYVRDEIHASLPRSALTFLRRASILEDLSGEVCTATLDDDRSGLRLARLADTTPLLEPRDPAHERYRCHPLFRESLHAELRQREPELIPTLHARASRWYADHGLLDQAIAHAAASGDAERTGALLWNGLIPLLTPDGVGRAEAWIDHFAPDAIAACPTLTLSAACTALAAGKAESALGYARDLAAAREQGRSDPALRTTAALISAITASGGIGTLQSAAVRMRRALSANSPWQGVCAWLEGMAAYLGGGDRTRSAHLFDEAATRGGRAFPVLAASALGARAMLAIQDQQWELAADLADEADAIIRAAQCELPITALALAVIAAVRAHEGRAAEAKHDVHRASVALAGVSDTFAWYGAQTRLVLAHASLHLADVVGARALLAQASRQARRAGEAAVFSTWFASAWSYLDTIAESSLTGPSALTIAELRVLRFLPSCRPFREIADQLGVSANTVKTQAHAVYRKLGAGSRSEAVLLAREAGLLGQ
jgi:LuxR family maltose regulon positive regulatory protein